MHKYEEMEKMVNKHKDIVFVAAHPGNTDEFKKHLEIMKISKN